MALLPQKKKPQDTIQPISLPAPKQATNKDIYAVNQTPPVNRPTGDFRATGGLMSPTNVQQYGKTGEEPIYGIGPQPGQTGDQMARAPAPAGGMPPKPGVPLTGGGEVSSSVPGTAPAPGGEVVAQPMPPKPTDGQGKPVIPGQVPTTDFTPAPIDTGDYTGVQSGEQLQYDPSEESLVANQITGLLDPDSPLMRKAIAQSQGYAASRGLQSSSIGGEIAMSSMIDKALPIAQQDAQTFNQAQSQQWQEQADINAENLSREHSAAMADKEGTIQNQLQNNQLGWQGAEKATDREFQSQMQDLQYRQQLGTLDKQQELQLAQMERSASLQTDRDAILQNYQVELNNLQNDQRWKELSAQIGSQMEQQTRGFDQQTRLEYGNAQGTAINAAMQAIGMAMQNPNMTAEQQQEAVNQIMGSLQSQANQLAIIYGAAPEPSLPADGVGPVQPGTGLGPPTDPGTDLVVPPDVTPPPATGPTQPGGSGDPANPKQGDTNEQGQTYYGGGSSSGYYVAPGWYPKRGGGGGGGNRPAQQQR